MKLHCTGVVLTCAVVILCGCTSDNLDYADVMAQQTILDLGGTVQVAPFNAVNLCDTSVTDADLVHLPSLTRLEKVNLRRTNVSDDCIPHLLSVQTLQEVDLTDTHVTDAGVERLKAAFPDITVIR